MYNFQQNFKKMLLGEKLKTLLIRKGKNAEYLANELGVSAGTVYGMYHKDSIESKHIQKICEIFDLPVSYFFEETGSYHQAVGDGGVALADVNVGGDFQNMADSTSKKNRTGVHDCSTLERLLEEKERLIEEKERVIRMQEDMIEILKRR